MRCALLCDGRILRISTEHFSRQDFAPFHAWLIESVNLEQFAAERCHPFITEEELAEYLSCELRNFDVDGGTLILTQGLQAGLSFRV